MDRQAGGASSSLWKHSELCLFLLVKYSFAFPVTLALLPRGELGCFVCADPPAGAGTCLGHSRKEESAPDHTNGFTSPLTSPVSSRNIWQVSLQAEDICVTPNASGLHLQGSLRAASKGRLDAYTESSGHGSMGRTWCATC